MTSDALVAFLGACFLVAGFVLVLHALGLVEHARAIPRAMHAALGVLSNPGLDDEAKEAAMRKQAIDLFARFALLTAGGAAAVSVPVAIVWLGGYLGWISFERIMDMSLDWRFLAGAGAVGVAAMYVPQKRPKPAQEFENRYSGVDRLLHEIAFASRPVQVVLSGLEDRVFGNARRGASKAPVFITALPRAGTTLLLELCCETREFASHSYRHMPFVLTPLLWQRFAARFRTVDAARERAHGDGMLVSVDSPEAFEEILWMQFWPSHYRAGSIAPWEGEPHAAFDEFFRRHRDKIAPAKRYISKNNLNIARIRRLTEAIPGSRVLVPFRDPYRHAQSLLHQHLRFSKIHEQDAFARAYMAGIGHFDFGANLKPVDFDRWLERNPYTDASTLTFWLAYWVAAYGHLARAASDRIRFSDFDKLCADPLPALGRIADYLGIEDRSAFLAQADSMGTPRTLERPAVEIDRELRRRVDTVYAALKEIAI